MIGELIRRLKEKFVNWLVKDVIIENIHTKTLRDTGNTLYVDVADFDHNTADGTRTESQMWYNSTDNVMRYRNDTETVDIGSGGVIAVSQEYDSSLANLASYTPTDPVDYSVAPDWGSTTTGYGWVQRGTTYWQTSYAAGQHVSSDGTNGKLYNNTGSAQSIVMDKGEIAGTVNWVANQNGTMAAGSNKVPAATGIYYFVMADDATQYQGIWTSYGTWEKYCTDNTTWESCNDGATREGGDSKCIGAVTSETRAHSSRGSTSTWRRYKLTNV